MLQRYFEGVVPAAEVDPAIVAAAEPMLQGLPEAIEGLRFNVALDLIWGFIGALNKYIDERAPWKLAKEAQQDALAQVMYSLIDGIRLAALAVSPFMPEAAKEIWRQLGIAAPMEAQRWETAMRPGLLPAATATASPEPIFRRIEEQSAPAQEKKMAQPAAPAPAPSPAEAEIPPSQAENHPFTYLPL